MLPLPILFPSCLDNVLHYLGHLWVIPLNGVQKITRGPVPKAQVVPKPLHKQENKKASCQREDK